MSRQKIQIRTTKITYKLLAGGKPIVDTSDVVFVLAGQDTELVLVLVLLQANHTFNWIVVSQFGLEEHFDGQVADHFGRGKIGQALLVHAHSDEEIEKNDNKRWRENNEREDIRHRPRKKGDY